MLWPYQVLLCFFHDGLQGLSDPIGPPEYAQTSTNPLEAALCPPKEPRNFLESHVQLQSEY